MRFILASASPRRRELLNDMGIAFEVCPSDGEETKDPTKPFDKIVEELARAKAEAVFGAYKDEDEAVVLGADTIVVLNNRILGKPKNEEDAFCALMELSGKAHLVYTGMCLIIKRGKKTESVCCSDSTRVFFSKLSENEIREYIKSGEPMDKAGSYGIQGIGAKFVEKIEGNYQTVVGLNTCSLYKLLKEYNLI